MCKACTFSTTAPTVCTECLSGYTLDQGGCCKGDICYYPSNHALCKDGSYSIQTGGSTVNSCVKLAAATWLPAKYMRKDEPCWKGYKEFGTQCEMVNNYVGADAIVFEASAKVLLLTVSTMILAFFF